MGVHIFFLFDLGEPIKTLASDHDVTMLKFSIIHLSTLQTRLVYSTSRGALYQINFGQSGDKENCVVCMDSR